MKNTLICFSVVMVGLFKVHGQDQVKTNYSDALRLIDSWIDAQKDYAHLPSITAAIVKDQEVIWSKGYGLSNIENKVAASPKTIYSICSISKLFTSVAIMQLYEKGKLHLDDKIESVLPGFNLKQQFPESGPITIRSLLTHSSGLPRESDYPYWTEPDFTFPTQDQVNIKLGKQQTMYPASTYFQYSNLGMTLLGQVVEKVSGVPYSTYVEENILKPLKLDATHSYLPNEAWGKEMAIGYGAIKRDGSRDRMNLFDAKGIKAAAGFSSNVEDLAKFAAWQMRVLSTPGAEVLKTSSLKEMQRVQWVDPDWKTFWGLGFKVSHQENVTLVGHGGSCPGYRTAVSIDPKEKMGYTVMINAGGESPDFFIKEIRDILMKAPKEKSGKTVETAKLEDYVGTYSAQPWGSETLITFWYGDLALVSFPNENPDESMIILQQVSADSFRVVRKDKTLADEIRFERDASGKVIKMWRYSNFYKKLK